MLNGVKTDSTWRWNGIGLVERLCLLQSVLVNRTGRKCGLPSGGGVR